jgi:peroxiredoxin
MKKLQIMILMLSMLSGAALAGGGGYQVGDKAADFKLQNIDGSWVSLSDYNDAKGYIVIFTCNHCPYAKAYEDRIITLDKIYTPKGFPVIAINPNDPAVQPADSPEKMMERAKDKGFTFPYLFDAKQDVFPVFGATKTPHVFILNKVGKEMVVEYIGAIDDNYEDASKVNTRYIEDAVDALLSGNKPSITNTKAIGCSIKVKKG